MSDPIHLSDRDRDRFLHALDRVDAKPAAALTRSAERHDAATGRALPMTDDEIRARAGEIARGLDALDDMGDEEEQRQTLEALMKAVHTPPLSHTFTIDEGDRQALLLAVAKLAVERPGWDWMLGNLAEKLQGREMFEGFKGTCSDGPWPTPRTPADGETPEHERTPVPGPGEFRCDACLGVFDLGDDDEAAAEAVAHGIDPGESGKVCDDCYHAYLQWRFAGGPAPPGFRTSAESDAELGPEKV